LRAAANLSRESPQGQLLVTAPWDHIQAPMAPRSCLVLGGRVAIVVEHEAAALSRTDGR
jgi:hypothetical protein